MMKLLSSILCFLALLAAGVLATETQLLFYWPAVVLLGAAGLLTAVSGRMRLMFVPADACLLSVLGLGAYLVGRAGTSPVVQYAREDGLLVLGCYVAYVLSATLLAQPRSRLALVWLMAVLVIGNLAVGFVQFSGRWSFHVVPGFARSFGEGRVGGFFNNANHLAAFLVMCMGCMGGVVALGRVGVGQKLVLGFLTLASGIGVALTQSRGGMLAAGVTMTLLAALSLWLVWKTQRYLFSRVLLGLCVASLLGGSVVYVVGAEKMKQRMVVRRADHDVRTPIWETARAQHVLSPVVGAGSRMFYDYCMKLRPATMQRRDLDALFVHNEYLQMLADYGWVGLALALCAVVAHFLHGVKFLRWFVAEKFPHTASLQSTTLAVAVGSLCGLVGVLVHAGVEFHFHVAATALLAAVLAGVLANPGFTQVTGWRLPLLRPLTKGALAAAGAALIFAAYQQAPADYAAAQAALAATREDRPEQMEQLTASIEWYGQQPEPYYKRGLLWMEQWRPDLPKHVGDRFLQRGVDDFRQAVALAPSRYLYPLALADAYDALQQEQAALNAVQLALQAAPWHEEARLGLALHLHRWRHFEEAERAYLWASEARLLNPEESLNWQAGYAQLMKDALAF